MNVDYEQTQFAELVRDSIGFRTSRIITTAVRLDLFDRFTKEYRSIEETRKDREQPSALEHICNALVSLELLKKDEDRYRCTDRAEKFLTSGGKYDARPLFRLYHQIYNMWSELEDAVTEGQTIETNVDASEDWSEEFIAAMEARAIFEKEEIADHVEPYLKGGRILDLGGGSGVYSRAMLREDPDATAVLADLPHVVEVAKNYIQEESLSDRMSVKELDLVEEEDYGDNFDLVFVSAILHIFGPETNRKILNRAFDALNAGGHLVLRDYVLDETETEPEGAVLFGLHMYLATDEGDVYTFDDYREWLEEAGFTCRTRVDLDNSSELLIVVKE